MNSRLADINDVANMIKSGKKLILAGDESALKKLPAGHWIAGTIPYFISDKGGEMTRDRIFVNEIPSYAKQITIRTYGEESIGSIYTDAPDNGFTVVIIPGSSPIHLSFALNAPSYNGFATKPLIGWIAGSHLDDIGKVQPRVFFGENMKVLDDRAVAMHITLPDNKYADINIINIFTQGEGPTITFPEDGFSASIATVDGEEMNFADYVVENDIDIRFPLVADYNGAMINISFQGIDADKGLVHFYAPVFKGVIYHQATAVHDYVEEFTEHIPAEGIDRIFFSCNCILNYLYSELEGQKTGDITGPITFGEIAYQLLNQTLAYVVIEDI